MGKEENVSLSALTKIVGPKGLYLNLCKRLKMNPIPVKVPVFGVVRTVHEVRNLCDNFAKGVLRDEKVERYLLQKNSPCIIDCGVNVGITIRWWLSLNKTAKVYGVDMLKETHEFTRNAIRGGGFDDAKYHGITAALWSTSGKQFTIDVQDPLWGDNNLFQKQGSAKTDRTFMSKTLDEIFAGEAIETVDLLKVDLEGAGAEALKGAAGLLKKTKYVVFENHGEEESKEASAVLVRNGFLVRRVGERQHLWWEKA
jgi:FkbM family methyltransferase